MPDLRKDPVVNRWVIIATERCKRQVELQPVVFKGDRTNCPFCPGNEKMTPPEIQAYRQPGTAPNTPGWWTRVVPNKYPALVIEGDLDLSEVAVSLVFNITRGIDNTSGEISEAVTAYCLFYIPLDPPCGGSMSMMDSPKPYDNNGVYEYPQSSDSEQDCPNPTTVGAGDYVWLESDVNVVTLERVDDSASGMIYYYGFDLTVDDYAFGQWYDLHTQGEEGGVPEYLVEEIQPTVPADFEILSPGLWGDYTHNRAEDFTYTWTPAETYPDAYFLTGIEGTIESTGNGGYVGSIPWDDGEHTYTSSELSQLVAEPVYFWAMSYIAGVEFGLPDSIYQTNETESYLYLQAYMILE